MRNSELVIRLGGDEFVIVIEDLDYLKYIKQIEIVMNRLHKAVERPFCLLNDETARVGMSVGIAFYPKDGSDTDSLLRKADEALYHTKLHKLDRKSWYHFFYRKF
jgi:diguanylate cyclase (GGDEF)-like protein